MASAAIGVGPELKAMRIYELGHVHEPTMPISPNHPAFQMALLRRHGDVVRPDGGSAANELIVTGGHAGTHIDALAHVSQEGMLHSSIPVSDVMTHAGFSELGADSIPPLVLHGVLLDVPGAKGLDRLPGGYEITVADLEAAAHRAGVSVRQGDAVLIRSGWSKLWHDREAFIGRQTGCPGPGADAASWLADFRPRVVGAETLALEHIPPGAGHRVLPVHRILLVEHGVYLIEAMDLDEIARLGVVEFTFIALPLRIRGATASPIRPIALVEGRS